MKTTRLFEKKWSNFFQENENKQLESYILKEVVQSGLKSALPGRLGVFTKDLPEIVRRCDKCMAQIIGIETYVDGQYPFRSWCIEEYGVGLNDNSWVEDCIKDIINAGVESDLMIYVDIPKERISILQNIYGIYN